MHSVASEGVAGKVKIRHLSCYCFPCIQQNYDSCEYKDCVEAFRSVTFGKSDNTRNNDSEAASDESADEDDMNPIADLIEMNPITDLIWKDSTIAIKPSSDSNREYFLFHVTSDGVITLNETINVPEYGHTYSVGDQVIKGYYYSYEKTSRAGCYYKRLSAEAVVPKESVLYVGVDLQKHRRHPNLHLLKPVDECDIMCSISSCTCIE